MTQVETFPRVTDLFPSYCRKLGKHANPPAMNPDNDIRAYFVRLECNASVGTAALGAGCRKSRVPVKLDCRLIKQHLIVLKIAARDYLQECLSIDDLSVSTHDSPVDGQILFQRGNVVACERGREILFKMNYFCLRILLRPLAGVTFGQKQADRRYR